jgi:outer membrane protein assembly factor BamE (lipoprotein component of BamABCDE complex)
MRAIAKILPLVSALIVSGCVNVDPQTGETIPRGDQRYKFADVEQQAKQLKDGMTKMQVMILLGSPAEASDGGNIWVYLPERPAVLIPSRALRLEFNNDVLVSHGYRAIVLGNTF